MGSQRQIAKVLGISQSTVSFALKNHPKISWELRKKVFETAERLGYRNNPYLAAVMKEARTRHKADERGEIALVVNLPSQRDWYRVSEAFEVYHRGAIRRATELGFRIETFYLKSPGMSSARADRILRQRGTQGLILAMPYRGRRGLEFQWQHYSCVATGSWYEENDFDRICSDQSRNMVLALEGLRKRGYERVGLVLAEQHTRCDARGMKWAMGYLGYQMNRPAREHIPILTGADWPPSPQKLQAWLRKWKPQALLTLTGSEEELLAGLGIRVPEDIGLACLVCHAGSHFAGINPRDDAEGAVTVEQVVAKMARNEYGLPKQSLQILVEGEWKDGTTLKRR